MTQRINSMLDSFFGKDIANQIKKDYMNTTEDKNMQKRDPKDYPKNGDFVLPDRKDFKQLASQPVILKNHTDDNLDEQQWRELTPYEKEECIRRVKNLMALKTPPGEKKATWDLKPNTGSDAVVNDSIQNIETLKFTDESDVFGEPTKENKFWVLTAMGFVPKGPARWWHPVLGEDLEWNWLLFDLETDDLTSLPPKLYRTGWAHGQRRLRMEFKKVLDI